jgi:hypothetical protein
VQALQQAKTDGALASRFEVDALPQPGRRYDRSVKQVSADGELTTPLTEPDAEFEIATPLPDLFRRPR